jgi:hypothetical protein
MPGGDGPLSIARYAPDAYFVPSFIVGVSGSCEPRACGIEQELVGIGGCLVRRRQAEGRAFGPASCRSSSAERDNRNRRCRCRTCSGRGHGRGLGPDVRAGILDHHVLHLLLEAGGVFVDPDLDAGGARGVDLEGDVGLGAVVVGAELVRVDGGGGRGRDEEGQDGAEDGEADAVKDGGAALHRGGIMQFFAGKAWVNLRRSFSEAGWGGGLSFFWGGVVRWGG